ncbi:SDR family oxidoreductase [Streptomyces sp. NBC_00670]|uniref:SDR family oxidoreductase n=1 Tax=Streptomyces sp. NBC_00670 TaxID=2975804 RepID=UPI002E329438|nr:SDR family oxidoreductase [Streptomyces sp. NBC_00670]
MQRGHSARSTGDRHVAVNTRAPFLLVGALAPGMTERGDGVIVLVGSSAARMPAPVGAAYGASKAGVEIPTRYLDHRVRPRGCTGQHRLPGPGPHRGHPGDARRTHRDARPDQRPRARRCPR